MEPDAQPREVVDSKVLAALAHPLRRRLLDVLKVHGPATVSMLAERTEQRVPNVSHHLRVLADVHLVSPAPELARDRRERWWRLETLSLRWSSADFADDAADAAVARTAQSINLDRHAALARGWSVAEEDERAWWGDAAFSTDRWLHLTPSELDELSHQMIDLLARWGDRSAEDDGRERRPVLVFAYGVPAQP